MIGEEIIVRDGLAAGTMLEQAASHEGHSSSLQAG
jgi:hypothetical protein